MKHFVTILLFGSIWGFIEATVGGAMHVIHIPFTGTIMASIGFAVLYAALKNGLKPSHLFAVSLVAASFKMLDIWLFSLPLFHMQVINPATAIAMQGLAAALILRKSTGLAPLASRMLFTASLSMVTFNVISLGIYGWPTHHTNDPMGAALIQLPIMTIVATMLSKGYDLIYGRINLSFNMRWQAATTALLIALTFLARAYI
ncbi:MAG: hypothetical protein HN337_02670 [Deltaproteobacteria bacterium]|nr:hypothetical protein [Deltaproteobacteria bacterium]